ncbi:MAG: sigma-54-dependent Fis family transcriptional regulator [Deltaproteobacteria bacterium]|nr:sigma-54-dependent Fis family transcriptional regulator [Deltaproteobacteria bacterium]
MRDPLRRVLDEVRGAGAFEPAARAALAPMLACVRAALASSRFAGKGILARAAAHLRTNEAYRALAVLEADASDPSGEAGSVATTSTRAWRWLDAAAEPVAVDVVLGRAHRIADPERPLGSEAAADASHHQRSLRQILDTGTTHMALLPLRDAAGVLAGMWSIEAECRAAMGSAFVWGECLDELMLLADVLGPLLAARPAARAAAEAPDVDPFLPVCGPTMAPIVRLLRVFAAQEETILLHGPTGVGKSRMARYVHERSPRRGHPFETVELLSVPAEMQAGELFGWRKGAFTGATGDHEGSVARARGGTLFLDEIDKLSLATQASLLQLIEARRYRALGDARGERQADVRFVVGTNADLRSEVHAGRFREDLYYRIHVLPVALPRLADRVDELGAWALELLRRRHGAGDDTRGAVSLTEDAEALLRVAPWPGNLRQLDNVLRRAYVMALATDPDEGRGGVVVRAEHVETSLGSEGRDVVPGRARVERATTDELWHVARRLVARVERLDLDDATVFRSFVLAAAIERAGTLDGAFAALGRDALVRSRNHHKTMQREAERVRAFCEALGEQPPAPVLGLLGSTDPSEI